MTIYLLNSDARHIPLADQSVQCVVTSPPYWGLRDYGTAQWLGGDEACDHSMKATLHTGLANAAEAADGNHRNESGTREAKQARAYRDMCLKCGAVRIDRQIGLERTPQEYVASIVQVMREVWRVLRDDGVLWLNLGDSYHQGNKGNSGKIRPGDKQGTNRGSLDTRRGASLGPNRITKLDGIKPKDLVGIPWRVAFALQDAGWYLRSDIIWSKPNPMPESVTDRPTKAHEYIFLLAKSDRYYYDSESIKEPAKVWEGQAATFERTGPVAFHVLPGQTAAQHRPNRNGKNAFRGQDAHRENETGKAHREGRDVTDIGNGPTRNRRSVWTVATRPYSGAHFATFPPELVEPMILAGSRPGDLVLDPFSGSGTVGRVSAKHGRRYVGLELNPAYIELAQQRTSKVQTALQFG